MTGFLNIQLRINQKSICILVLSLSTVLAGYAQGKYTYTIKADTVKITNCDSAELILENHTQGIPGFLFNTGNGRTVFQRGALRLNDSTYLVGADTVKIPNAWVQGGNSFGTAGILGTLDNNPVDFYSNNQQRVRLSGAGNLVVGSIYDNGFPLQVVGTGGIYIDPNLSIPGDLIKIGGYLNAGDGQDAILRASADGGGSWYNILVARQGYIGLGYGASGWYVGNPPIQLYPGGTVGIQSPTLYYGNTGGPYNASALITSVSNTNEWNENLNNYPNGQNYYYFGTVLQTPQPGYMRAPLKIGAVTLHLMTGASDTDAVEISEAQNVLIGTTTDNGNRLQVNGTSYFSGAVQLAGLTQDNTQTQLLVADANGNLYYRSAASLAATDMIRSSLAVNGPISAQQLILSRQDWADYVFDSSYRLPALPEVERYIRQQHHLPGIASAAEVRKDGADVGDNQAVLLKKVEELTLYTIQQDHEIESLKKEMAELRQLITSKSEK